ncbi:AlkA N-terminal domain-containing protein [Propionimicrobium sp. PCR01-08-3]|uniref:DNA-3-methyladenine glycosylase 2 family protein n=1 Tax=Propionimicrobium sp. PCR01-08-3 TaxID=3052086 RepID=UPI00255C4FB5|nr:AlkA N-terminal domain-containing protein [Propionimicrobium sp. PCR01-08-3]WIY82915.1 Ada metal-binding domain-containing protein [Propionimicrobium sp. PCR01-08-3]
MAIASARFDERYRAVEARDVRFDGQFVMAVRTTGIYCRPSCPARTPKRSNVTFYPTSAAAHEAGFRACKRCLPEAAPGSPQWNLRQDTVGRAMRLIADGVVERECVPGLAARLGYSSRQLSRLLVAEVGAGPLALARAQRAHTARMLLIGTDLAVAEVAFSSGFGSVRQCNDTVREVFGMSPTELRSRRRGVAPVPGAIDLVLPVREPFDAAGLFGWMAARALPGIEVASQTGYARTLQLPGGVTWFELREDVPGRIRLRARVTELSDLGPLVSRVRRLFDLDADPQAIDSALAREPELALLVAATPGIRVPGAADPHEMLIRAMIGQQVSVASARTALGRLVQALGATTDLSRDETAEPRQLFPTMDAIAEHGREVLRGPVARVDAIVQTAAALADGSLVLTAADDGAEQRSALLARKGIGPWTADYVRMRVLGDPDVLLPGDGAARSGAARAGIPSTARGLEIWAAQLSPWRSYLTAHLWRAAGQTRTEEGR